MSVVKILDFYSGFELEPEIRIRVANDNNPCKIQILIWEGYFDSIINLIEPNESGEWEGVTLKYHLHTGWYDEELWELEQQELFLSQLKQVNANKLEEREQHLLNRMIEVVTYSLNDGDKIYFERH